MVLDGAEERRRSSGAGAGGVWAEADDELLHEHHELLKVVPGRAVACWSSLIH